MVDTAVDTKTLTFINNEFFRLPDVLTNNKTGDCRFEVIPLP